MEVVVVQGHRRATVNATVVGSIPTRGNGILNIFTYREFGEKWGTEVDGAQDVLALCSQVPPAYSVMCVTQR